MSAYRDEVEALRARAEAAEAELARLKGEVVRPPVGSAPEALVRLLAPGDRIAWWGRPVVWQLALASSAHLCILGAAWSCVFFVERALPPVFVAAHLTFGALLAAAAAWNVRRARRTYWALTDREGIVVTTGPRTSVRRIRRDALGEARAADPAVQMFLREALRTRAAAT